MLSFSHDKVVVRPITPAFFDENLQLLNAGIAESHFLARSELISPEESMRFFETFLNHPNTIYLLALFEKRELIGNITALPRFEDLLDHVATVGYLVHPDYRRKGVGSLLMESLIAEAQKRGAIKILMAEVAGDNILSLALLKKFQFEEIGRLTNGMRKKGDEFVDLLHYAKCL